MGYYDGKRIESQEFTLKYFIEKLLSVYEARKHWFRVKRPRLPRRIIGPRYILGLLISMNQLINKNGLCLIQVKMKMKIVNERW